MNRCACVCKVLTYEALASYTCVPYSYSTIYVHAGDDFDYHANKYVFGAFACVKIRIQLTFKILFFEVKLKIKIPLNNNYAI